MGNMQRSLDKRPGNSSIPKRRREAKLCLRRQRSVPALRSLPLAYHLSKKQRPKSHKLTEKARRRIRLIVKPKKEISSSELSQRLSSYVTICKRACPIDDTPMESGWEAKKKLRSKDPKFQPRISLSSEARMAKKKRCLRSLTTTSSCGASRGRARSRGCSTRTTTSRAQGQTWTGASASSSGALQGP